jgi:hypothetical protein
MMTSALLRHGPEHVRGVERDLVAILDERGYASISELRGSMSRRSMPDPAGFERANYARTLASRSSHAEPRPGGRPRRPGPVSQARLLITRGRSRSSGRGRVSAAVRQPRQEGCREHRGDHEAAGW